MNDTVSALVFQIIAELEKIPTLDKEADDFVSSDDERDTMARQAAGAILDRLGVYGAYACPLCLA